MPVPNLNSSDSIWHVGMGWQVLTIVGVTQNGDGIVAVSIGIPKMDEMNYFC